VAFAEQFVRDTDVSFVGRDGDGKSVSLRELLVHVIEEYARHNGHADLLGERIDGRVGQQRGVSRKDVDLLAGSGLDALPGACEYESRRWIPHVSHVPAGTRSPNER
jgi:hypothetical protein